MKTPKLPKVCAREGCQEWFVPSKKRGRPRRYCSPQCRALDWYHANSNRVKVKA